jgi:hypothetical protein
MPVPDTAVSPTLQQPTTGTGGNSNPFGYTMGSLLTPWSGKFTAPGGGGGAPSGAPAPPPSFSFGTFNPGSFSAEQFSGGPDFKAATPNFEGARFQSPGEFQAPVGTFDPGQFSGGRMAAPAQFQGGPEFQGGPALTLGRVDQQMLAARPGFTAPTAEEAMGDPGYQFRMKEAIRAMTNNKAAQGLARSSGYVKGINDYVQDSASQEYDKVYGRRRGEYDQDTADQFGTFDRNQAERFGAFDRNTQAASAENMTAYERAASENDRTYGRASSEYDRDFSNTFAVDEANYGRGASEFDRNAANARTANETTYGRAASEDDRTYGRQFSEYQDDYRNRAAENDRNFGREFDTYQANYGNRLNAFTANTGAALGGASLNYQMQSGAYDRNYQNALTTYQMDAQAQAAAAAGAAGASSQDYNRALNEYEMQRDEFWSNQDRQYSRLSDQQRLGFSAAQNQGANSNAYGQNSAEYYYNQGNAGASGIIGGANAFSAGAQGVGNAAIGAAAYYGTQARAPQQTYRLPGQSLGPLPPAPPYGRK